MTEYAISTNLISYAPAKKGIFGWPQDGPEAEVVQGMVAGDWLIPKFAQWPTYGNQEEYQRGVCAVVDADYDEERADYMDTIKGGDGAVPFLMRVTGKLDDDPRFPSNQPWSVVSVELHHLDYPLTTHEFLKLRVTPPELARQFKANVANGRHIQEVDAGTAASILKYGEEAERGVEALRQFSLVKAETAAEAVAKLDQAGRSLRVGDRAFLVTGTRMPGVYAVRPGGKMEPEQGEEINLRVDELGPLVEAATQRKAKAWKPWSAEQATKDLTDFIASDDEVRDVEWFPHFHDYYVGLARKVNQAQKLVKQPIPGDDEEDDGDDGKDDNGEDDIQQEELEALLGLTISAVRAKLPGFVLPDSVFADAVTALRSGKHLLLSGPPGTGKSTVASALCRAVVDEQFDIATATADWTTFDTIGGLIPQSDGTLLFHPGIVLRCLERGWWLVIDELNRADIDKAFGPLFTLLAGTDSKHPSKSVVLPFQGKDGKSIEIGWAETRSHGAGPYVLTPSWRLIGTLNVSDKASLFQLSFAFLRRFAIVDVPLPPVDTYTELFASRCNEIDEPDRSTIVEAAILLAFGKRELGPAILLDIASFVSTGTTVTETGKPSYEDPISAFLAAVRLYAAPQYEGAEQAEIDDALSRLKSVIEEPPEQAWNALGEAFRTVALA